MRAGVHCGEFRLNYLSNVKRSKSYYMFLRIFTYCTVANRDCAQQQCMEIITARYLRQRRRKEKMNYCLYIPMWQKNLVAAWMN